MRKTKSGVKLITKNDEDNKLLENAIRANAKFKESVTLRQAAKRRQKTIT